MKCFAYALRGFAHTVGSERNMRVHLGFLFYVTVCGHITHLEPWEWAAALICIGLVISAECVNTALERLCDELHPGKSEGIAHVKDAAAAGVLACAAVSAAVGGLIFFKVARIRAVLAFCADSPAAAVLLIITVPVWAYFVFAWKRRAK